MSSKSTKYVATRSLAFHGNGGVRIHIPKTLIDILDWKPEDMVKISCNFSTEEIILTRVKVDRKK